MNRHLLVNRHARLSLLLLLFVPLLLQAGDKTENAGAVWTELGVSKSLPYNLSVDLDLGYRTIDWFEDSYRSDIGLGINYKLNRHWKFSLGYAFIMKKYPIETNYKISEETEWKYRNTTTGENIDATEFMGSSYTDADGVLYKYRGQNDAIRYDTRIDESFWRQRHRLYIDASYTYKLWKTLRISVRERYQMTMTPSKTIDRTRYRNKEVTKYRDPIYDGNGNLSGYDEVIKYWQEGNTIYAQDITDGVEGDINNVTNEYMSEHGALNTMDTYDKEKKRKMLHLLRSRLKLSIDRKGWKWEPYISVEAHNNLGEQWHLDKVRTAAGVEYSVAKGHKLGLGYIFNHENDDDGNYNIHAVSIGYKYSF